MNSLEELNQHGNTAVNFLNASDYVISMSDSDNDITITQNEEAVFLLPKQVTVNTLSGAFTDLQVTVSWNLSGAIKSINYTGNLPFITVARISDTAFRIYGIQTVSAYNAVFSDLFVILNDDRTDSFQITVQLNDQLASTRNYTVVVVVIEQPEFVIPTSIEFNEDVVTDIQPISITDAASDATYTVQIASGNVQQGLIRFQDVSSANVILTNTRDVINGIFSSGQIQWQPAADFNGNSSILYSQTRLSDGAVHANGVSIQMVGIPSAEFSLVSDYWTENGTSSDLTISVVDVAVGKNYQGTITVNTGGELFVGNNAAGNTVSFVGNKTEMNNQLSNLRFVSNNFGDFPWSYTQIQTTDNINQGTANGLFKTPRLLGSAQISSDQYQQSQLLNVGANFQFPSGSEFYQATGAFQQLGTANGSPIIGFSSLQTVSSLVPVDSTSSKVGTHAIIIDSSVTATPNDPSGRLLPILINKLDPAANDLQPGQTGTIEFWATATSAAVLSTGGFRQAGLDALAPGVPMEQRFNGLFPNSGFSLLYDQGQVFALFLYDYVSRAAGTNGVFGIDEPYVRSAAPINTQLPVPNYHHVAITVDTNHQVRIFVNGIEGVYLRSALTPPTDFAEQTNRIVTEWYATTDGLPFESGSNQVITGLNPYYFWGQSQAVGKRISEFRSDDSVIIDNVRISNNIRYTAPFTPPITQQFSTDGNTVLLMRGISAGI